MSFSHTLMLGAFAASLLSFTAVGAAFRGSEGSLNHMDHHGIDLLQELENRAGLDHRQATESRVDRLEQALKPMWAAMPKDSAGRLEAAGVRYLLHRLFVQRHGWFVDGLDAGGDAWDSASPAAVFKDHSSDHHSLFGDRLDHGFTLHQVAVFAATLETMVHGENIDRLGVTYRLQGLSRSETLTEAEAAEAIRGYMVVYVRFPQGTNISTVTKRVYDFHDRSASETYSTWPDTINFAKAIRSRIVEDVLDEERTSWETSLKVVEEIGERYGRWQSKECNVLKNMLTAMEIPGTGRVALSDFYAPALHNSTWNFVESVPYLRQLGALDESNPQQPAVIIPNYLNAPTNCVASSKFYSVCCIDECEDLLGTLEGKIAAPDATPAQIADIISQLPSDTVQAPRLLSPVLMSRLEEIASHHEGKVPLHGRMFAQWLHHVYPRECPFPHISGTTNPVTQEEWLRTDKTLEVEQSEIRRILEEAKLVDRSAETAQAMEPDMPWHFEEELFVARPKLPQAKSGFMATVFKGLLLAALVLAAYVLSQPKDTSKKGLLPSYSSNSHAKYV